MKVGVSPMVGVRIGPPTIVEGIPMTSRPRAVTVVGWLFRVGGIVGMVFAIPYALWGPEWFGGHIRGADRFWVLPPLLIFLVAFLSSLVFLVCGNGILEGRNWSRVLAVAVCVVATLSPFLLYENQPLLWFNGAGNLACALALWFYLFRPEAGAFFAGGEARG